MLIWGNGGVLHGAKRINLYMFFFQTIDVATDSDLQCMFRINYLKSNIDKVGCNDSYFESKLDVVIFYIIENSFGYYNC